MNQKQAEINCPTKLKPEEILHHQNLPFSVDSFYEDNERVAIASHLIDFALILAELQPIKKGQILLDIGAGGGWTSEWFNKCGINAYPVDISPNWKEIYQRHFPLPYIICDAEQLTSKFEDEYTDFIVFYNSLHHMQNQKRIIAECYKVLKKGGKIVFLEPGYRHGKSKETIATMKRYKTIERGINPFKLRRDCLKSGFKKSYLKADYSIFPNLRVNAQSDGTGNWLRTALCSPFFSLFSAKGRTFVVGVK